MSRQCKRPLIRAYAYDRRGNLLAAGRNSYTKTHPVQALFAKLAGMPDRIYLHAEIDALTRANGFVHELVIERFNRDGEPMLAKPCPVCQLAIRHWGVKKIRYTV